MSLDIYTQSCYHHSLGNKHIHQLQKIPLLLFWCSEQNMNYPLKFLSIQSFIANYRHYVVQQISGTYYSCITVTFILLEQQLLISFCPSPRYHDSIVHLYTLDHFRYLIWEEFLLNLYEIAERITPLPITLWFYK